MSKRKHSKPKQTNRIKFSPCDLFDVRQLYTKVPSLMFASDLEAVFVSCKYGGPIHLRATAIKNIDEEHLNIYKVFRGNYQIDSGFCAVVAVGQWSYGEPMPDELIFLQMSKYPMVGHLDMASEAITEHLHHLRLVAQDLGPDASLEDIMRSEVRGIIGNDWKVTDGTGFSTQDILDHFGLDS